MLDVIVTEPWRLAILALVGLFAGVLGGMLGVGGSIIMIPGMVALFGAGVGPEAKAGFNQHAYQAAAMIANVAVSIPATLRHRRARAIDASVLRWMLPAAVLGVLAGVWVSNLGPFAGGKGGVWLGRILAGFLVYEVAYNLHKVLTRSGTQQDPVGPPTITPRRSGAAGGGMGLIGGLLGVGGGIIAVPLQQTLMRLPLRTSIANSAAVMCASALVGACFKNATLHQHEAPWYAGVVLAALLVPSCMLGGHFGAALTHRLPLRQVRLVFALLMAAAAWKLARIPGLS